MCLVDPKVGEETEGEINAKKVGKWVRGKRGACVPNLGGFVDPICNKWLTCELLHFCRPTTWNLVVPWLKSFKGT